MKTMQKTEQAQKYIQENNVLKSVIQPNSLIKNIKNIA